MTNANLIFGKPKGKGIRQPIFVFFLYPQSKKRTIKDLLHRNIVRMSTLQHYVEVMK